jgi:glutamate racemase
MQINTNIKVGVCDSGLGGLSILYKIWQRLPTVSTIYLADSKYAPYGNKDSTWIQQRILNICLFLVAQKIDAIVVACNTATTHAIQFVRNHIQHIPIIGVEPGVKPAIQYSKNKHIGILATYNTLHSQSFQYLLQRLNAEHGNMQYIQQAGLGLVECIEKGFISLANTELVNLCHTYMQNFIAQKVDTVVLGCTHYPFLLPILQHLYPDIYYIETAEAVVNQLSKKINACNFNAVNNIDNTNITAEHVLYSTLNSTHIQQFIEQINANNNVQYAHLHNMRYAKLDDLSTLN